MLSLLGDCVEEIAAGGGVEPSCVAGEVVVVGEAGVGFRMEDREVVVGLGECELGVAESRHGRESFGLRGCEGADGLVAVEEGVEVVDVDRNTVGVVGIGDEGEPLDDVALDGLGQVVHRVGSVGEAEVDDGCGMRVRGVAAPEKVRGVEIVVGPERGRAGRAGQELGVEGREEIESLGG